MTPNLGRLSELLPESVPAAACAVPAAHQASATSRSVTMSQSQKTKEQQQSHISHLYALHGKSAAIASSSTCLSVTGVIRRFSKD